MENQQSMGDQFLDTINQFIEKNIDNEHFSVEDLAQHAGLSRSMLHRKLKKLTGKSASDLITEKRLLKALELLEKNVATVSEIAYQVGFNSPSYFNKVFKDHFQVSPGDLRKGIVKIPQAVLDEQFQKNGHSDQKFVKKRAVVFLLVLLGFILAFMGSYYLFDKHIPKKKSVVILPFDNLSSDPENQYYADGITEDILNDLFLISNLRVLSRTTTKSFRGEKLTAKEIADEVNAQNVLEGSIRHYGNKIRISVQLIDARHDQHLWSANYDRELNDLMGVQGDIALQIAEKLNAVISDKEIQQIERISTENPQAYDYYLKGRFLLHKANSEQRFDFDKNGAINCLKYYEKAIAADTNFVEAYAGLANARFNLSAWGWLPLSEGGVVAKNLCEKALEIDSKCAEAHAVLGAYDVWVERKIEEGRKELMTAVQLNPNFATSQQWYAQLLMITGPIKEARKHVDRAVELEPYFWVIQNLNAWVYYFEEKYNDAIEACKIAQDLNPNFLDNKWLFFLNYAKLGEGDKAMKELQSIVKTYQGANNLDKEIQIAYSEAGINGIFMWMINLNTHNPIPVKGLSGHPFFIAWWYAILGQREESVFWLEKNMETNVRFYTYFNLIATCPDFDILRDDPRFLAIIDEIGLTPYNQRKAK